MEFVKGKFSVILPYYNGKKYILETVESVLAQTYKDLELLLIDDGSPSKADADLLVSLIETKKDTRIKYFRKPNGGLSETRNFGLANSDGEFIAFIDQDDLWAPEKLALQAEVFLKNAGVKFICTDAHNIGEKTEEMRIGEKWGLEEGPVSDTFGRLIKGSFVACSTVAFRRSALEGVGYSNRAFAVIPDYEYFFRFAEKMDFYFVAKSLVSYRLHEENTTKQVVRGECEMLSVLFNKNPRNFFDRLNLAVHFFRCMGIISWYWLVKIVTTKA